MLYESLKEQINKVGSLLIEVGTKNTHEAYVPLLQLLWNSNMRCFENATGKEIASFQDMEKYILKDEAGAVSADLWFIKRDLITK